MFTLIRELHKQIRQSPDRFNIILILVSWLVMLLLVNPSGNFPLNDDWNYARSVRTLAETGRLEITCWNCSSNLLQILYGALITKVFGFSFLALRISSQIFAAIGGVFMYLLIKRVSANQFISLIAAFTLIANPIYFNLANTFMTDVPFLALLVASAYFSVRTFQDGGRVNFVMTLALAIAATFIRQYGSIFLFCFLLIYTWKMKFRGRVLATSVAVLAAVAGLLLLFRLWLGSSGLPGCYLVWMIYLQERLSSGFFSFVRSMFESLFIQLIYLGLFIVPLAIACIPWQFGKFNSKERTFALVCASELFVCLLFALFFKQLCMPLSTNVLFDGGVGPELLAEIKGAPAWVALAKGFWIIVTVFSALGFSLAAAMLISEFVHIRQAVKQGRAGIETSVSGLAPEIAAGAGDGAVRLLFAGFLLLYTFIITFTGLIDRYILPALPALCVLISMLAKNSAEKETQLPKSAIAGATALIMTLLLSFFCVLSTHDYFTCNRARWQALDYARQELKAPAASVDGGWEFNGWMSYAPELRNVPVAKNLSMRHGDAYAITLGPVSGYRTVRVWSFRKWLPLGSGSICLLEKIRQEN